YSNTLHVLSQRVDLSPPIPAQTTSPPPSPSADRNSRAIGSYFVSSSVAINSMCERSRRTSARHNFRPRAPQQPPATFPTLSSHSTRASIAASSRSDSIAASLVVDFENGAQSIRIGRGHQLFACECPNLTGNTLRLPQPLPTQPRALAVGCD